MCRSRSTCSEIPDPRTWSQKAPLPPPESLRRHLPAFHESIRHAAKGDVAEARKVLSTFPSERAQNWYVQHGQVSGNFRFRLLGRPAHSPFHLGLGPRNPPASLSAAILRRDNYHCRYCGLPVISRAIFVVFALVVGPDAFTFGRTNLTRHGAALISWAQIDHVVPYTRGGATDMSNLVTACCACNFGKSNYELAQIGVSDPRSRKPSGSDWDGLVSLLPALLARTKLAS